MGRSVLIHRIVKIRALRGNYSPMKWHTRKEKGASGCDGKPTEVNLVQWVQRFEESQKPGGVNAHVGPDIVLEAEIYNQKTGEIEATYKKPLFEIVE